MALIKPIKSYIYNSHKVEVLSAISPPYDVINDEKYEGLARIPYNSSIIIKNKTFPPSEDWYENVKKTFEKWLKEEIVVENGEAIFIYKQKAEFRKRTVERIGFISLLYTQPWKNSKIIPHERTYELPKKDRYKLITKTGFQFEPIFCVFEDNGKVKEFLEKGATGTPFIDGKGSDNVEHTVWKVEDRKFYEDLRALLEEKSVMIADGHHRFEVAKKIGEEFGNKDPEHPSSYVLSFFSPFAGEYDSVFPIHRGIKKEVNIEKLEKLFHLTELSREEEAWMKFFSKNQSKKGKFVLLTEKTAFGGYLKENENNQHLDYIIGELDVAVLHYMFLDNMFSNEEDMEWNIVYTPFIEEGIEKLERSEIKAFFILPSPPLQTVFKIAEQNKKLPHKSTYFYPKIPSGIVFYKTIRR